MTLADRFDQKVMRLPEAPGCWLWIGAMGRQGYGHLWGGATYEQAHRVSYELHRGRVPDGICVLHRCDVRACVRPDHLFLGTKMDNTQDALRKGRMRYMPHFGEENGNSKLTTAIVAEIRSRWRPGIGPSLAREYGVTHPVIYGIVNGKGWRGG